PRGRRSWVRARARAHRPRRPGARAAAGRARGSRLSRTGSWYILILRPSDREAFMRRFAAVSGLAVVIGLGFLTVAPSSAGPEKLEFPANWETFVPYLTLDRYDVKQYRELYASSQAAVDAMKQGRPLPDRTVLVLIQYKAQADAQGTPLKDSNGRF